MISTRCSEKNTNRPTYRILSVGLALLCWELAALLLGDSLLLASPWQVILRLFQLLGTPSFYLTLWHSFSRIIGGFLLATVCGGGLGLLAGIFPVAEILLRPFMLTVKTVPVASFIILALIWLSSARLSVFISFLMVLPIIYNGVLNGMKNKDIRMEQAAYVFRLSPRRKFIYLILPRVKPFFFSACTLALGLCWKAGIAAEVIGVPSGSIGEALYQAKIYLETVDLFCWTLVIVLLSLGFEKGFLFLLKKLWKVAERL